MTASVPPRSTLPAQAPALMTGALLGALIWELARMPEPTPYRAAMGLVLLASGAASFVMFRLHRHAEARGPAATRQVLAREARATLTWLSAGVLAAIYALPVLLA